MANWFDRRRREPHARPILLLLQVTRRNASPRTLRQNSRPDGERIEFYEEKINNNKRYENDCPHSNDYHLFVFVLLGSKRSNKRIFFLIHLKIIDLKVFETSGFRIIRAFYYLFNVFRSELPLYFMLHCFWSRTIDIIQFKRKTIIIVCAYGLVNNHWHIYKSYFRIHTFLNLFLSFLETLTSFSIIKKSGVRVELPTMYIFNTVYSR